MTSPMSSIRGHQLGAGLLLHTDTHAQVGLTLHSMVASTAQKNKGKRTKVSYAPGSRIHRTFPWSGEQSRFKREEKTESILLPEHSNGTFKGGRDTTYHSWMLVTNT